MASYAGLSWLGRQTEHFVDLDDRQYDPGVLYVMANLAHFVSQFGGVILEFFMEAPTFKHH